MSCDKVVPGLGEMEYDDRPRRIKVPTLSFCHFGEKMIKTYKITIGVNDSEVSFIYTIRGLFNLRVDSNTRGQRY